MYLKLDIRDTKLAIRLEGDMRQAVDLTSGASLAFRIFGKFWWL